MRPTISRGLTLIEVLVSMAILSLLSLLAYRALDSTLRTRDQVAAEAGRWRELGFFFDRLRDDLDQRASRGPRSPAGDRLPVFAGGESDLDVSTLAFGSGSLRRVQYRKNGEDVELLLWPSFDAAAGSVPEHHTLVHSVRTLKFAYLTQARQWVAAWPPPVAEWAAPGAVRVELILADGTAVSRLFALPR